MKVKRRAFVAGMMGSALSSPRLLSAGPGAAAEWPQWRGPDRTGVSRETGLLVEASPQSYVEKSRFEQPERRREMAWSHPVVVGGRLYIRDQDLMLCYDVRGA